MLWYWNPCLLPPAPVCVFAVNSCSLELDYNQLLHTQTLLAVWLADAPKQVCPSYSTNLPAACFWRAAAWPQWQEEEGNQSRWGESGSQRKGRKKPGVFGFETTSPVGYLPGAGAGGAGRRGAGSGVSGCTRTTEQVHDEIFVRVTNLPVLDVIGTSGAAPRAPP